MSTPPPPVREELGIEHFRALAEWRHQIRKFLAFSEEAARSVGIEPQQHQLLLAVKGLPQGRLPTMGVIADRMAIRSHTVVELVDRLVQRGLIRRETCATDRRAVLLTLTPRAEWMLGRLSEEHRRQLEISGPALVQAITAVVDPGQPTPSPNEGAQQPSGGAPVHVLCVDDEPLVLQGLGLHLEPCYRVSYATSGAEGLGLCAVDPPDVVVSDLRMPEMDGTTFLRKVRDRTPNTMRILLTGQADLDDALVAVNEARVFRLLTKPCRPGVLLSALEAAADERQTLIGAGPR